MRALIASGNPFDGVVFTGPFDDTDAAEAWAECEMDDEPSWWAVEPAVDRGDKFVVLACDEADGIMVLGTVDNGLQVDDVVVQEAGLYRTHWVQRVQSTEGSSK